jgi:hypothetical protein
LSVAFRLRSITRNTFLEWARLRGDASEDSSRAFAAARIEHHLMASYGAGSSKRTQSITRNTPAPWALAREYPDGLTGPPDLLRAVPEKSRQKGRFIRPFSVLGTGKITSPKRRTDMKPK